jgi:hypothetical protein
MKVTMHRDGLLIEPQGAPDEMYLENVVGAGDGSVMVRRLKGDAKAKDWGALVLSATPVAVEPAKLPIAEPERKRKKRAAKAG